MSEKPLHIFRWNGIVFVLCPVDLPLLVHSIPFHEDVTTNNRISPNIFSLPCLKHVVNFRRKTVFYGRLRGHKDVVSMLSRRVTFLDCREQ